MPSHGDILTAPMAPTHLLQAHGKHSMAHFDQSDNVLMALGGTKILR